MVDIIRDFSDSFKTTDFTTAITEVENQYGFINSQGMFDSYNTSEKAIAFDKDSSSITLLPQVSRTQKQPTTGHEHKVETFLLPLTYFKHLDSLTAEDIYRWRKPGSSDKETVERATAEKVTDMRYLADQMQEYLKLQALKGIFKTPDGAVVANMFTEFGIIQSTQSFALGTGTTDVNSVIANLKRTVKAGLKTSSMSGIDVYCDESFFDKLVSHASMKSYYLNGDGASSRYRDNTSDYMQWGVMDMFVHKGVRFISYNPTFNLPTGTTEDFLAADTAVAIPTGARGLYRSYFGPSNKLSAVGQPGQELYLRTYVDPRDEFVDFELEMAPLHFSTQPASIVACTA